jgi:hypothetical protein
MNVKILLYAAFKELEKASKGTLSGTKIESIADVINRFAIYSAVSTAANAIPGVGSIITMLTQTGLVWGTYLKINETLGISMKENVAKFIGSAILTNISANAISYAAVYIAASLLSWLPGANLLMIAFMAAMGYILIYVSALLYLKLLTEVMKAKGSFDLDDSDETKDLIKRVVKDTDVQGAIKEAQSVFDESKSSGEFDAAKNNMICPYCGETIQPEQKFCSMYGKPLK